MKTNYIIPALDNFSQGMEDIYSPYNKSVGSLFGVVSFKSQCIPNSTCNTYGPYSSPQKFLKSIDNLDLTGGKSESNANLAEGLATALVCFQDLENIRDKDAVVNKHCILITNSSPYSMHVTECYEYEGKTVEQLASIFLEKNINLSIISPRKIPVLYELFEKSGGDLGVTSSKNYSKDPRHLVLLKGFSLKERPASPNVNPPSQASNQNVQQSNPPQQTQQNPQQQQAQQQQQQPNQQDGIGNMLNQNPQIRPQMVRANNPQNMMPGQQQGMGMQGNQFGNPGMNFPNRPQNPQQQNQTQMWNANQQRPPFINNQQNNMMQANMMQQQQQQNPSQQPANSALISQLSQPPSLPPQMTANQQQPNMVRMNLQQQQQMNPMQMQQQGQNPNMNIGNMQGNQMMQNNPQMQQGQIPPQMNMMQQPTNQQPMPTSERIWHGILEWTDKQNQQNTMRQVQCEVHSSLSKDTKEVEVRGDNWPAKLIMQLMPRQMITNVGGHRLRDAKIVIFQWGQPTEAFQALTKIMANGFAGCVHFNANQCDLKILILLYMPEKKSYYGFIPNDQVGYVEELRRIVQMSKTGQNVQNPNQVGIRQMNPGTMNPMNAMNNQGNAPMNQQMGGNMQPQGDQNQMMFNQMQMQGNNPGMVNNVMMQQNQQRMQRPPMMQNNLRHLLQQNQQFRPQGMQQMGGPQQQQQQQQQQVQNQQMHGGMDANYDNLF